jgi:L-amino acid N-acyltransferase YncA
MTTDFTFHRMSEKHRKPVIDIFNHYVQKSYAAYLEQCVPYEFYDLFLKIIVDYPAFVVETREGVLIGFGMVHAYHPFTTFSHTAEASYFIHHDHCGKGIGSALLKRLLEETQTKGILTVLASISSLNERSLRFHRKHGFVECGRFRSVCRKKGRFFDIVWMQKMLP